MSDDQINLLLGRIDGKLDSLIDTFKAHVEEDNERAKEIGKTLDAHSAVINQAKGAKGAVVYLASLVGGAIVVAAEKLFLKG
jgi:hypothetical protein